MVFLDFDFVVIENYECIEEFEILVVCEVEEFCGDLEDKIR